MVPRPAVSASPRNLLKMWMLRPQPGPTESETVSGVQPPVSFRLPGWQWDSPWFEAPAPSSDSQTSVYKWWQTLSLLKCGCWPLTHRDFIVLQWGCRKMIHKSSFHIILMGAIHTSLFWGSLFLKEQGHLHQHGLASSLEWEIKSVLIFPQLWEKLR